MSIVLPYVDSYRNDFFLRLTHYNKFESVSFTEKLDLSLNWENSLVVSQRTFGSYWGYSLTIILKKWIWTPLPARKRFLGWYFSNMACIALQSRNHFFVGIVKPYLTPFQSHYIYVSLWGISNIEEPKIKCKFLAYLKFIFKFQSKNYVNPICQWIKVQIIIMGFVDTLGLYIICRYFQ